MCTNVSRKCWYILHTRYFCNTYSGYINKNQFPHVPLWATQIYLIFHPISFIQQKISSNEKSVYTHKLQNFGLCFWIVSKQRFCHSLFLLSNACPYFAFIALKFSKCSYVLSTRVILDSSKVLTTSHGQPHRLPFRHCPETIVIRIYSSVDASYIGHC